jgi:hypothetical protein
VTFVGPAIGRPLKADTPLVVYADAVLPKGSSHRRSSRSSLIKVTARRSYYFRDHQGLEIDLVVPRSDHALTLIEANASRTVTPGMAKPLVRLRQAVSRYDVTNLVVHRGNPGDAALAAVWPGVKAIPVDRFLLAMAAPVRRRAHR